MNCISWRRTGWSVADSLAGEARVPLASSVDWVETLLNVKTTTRGDRGLQQELGEWLGVENGWEGNEGGLGNDEREPRWD